MAIYKIRIVVAKAVGNGTETDSVTCFKDKNTIKAAFDEAVQLCNEMFPPNGIPVSRYVTAEEIPA